MKLNLKEAMGFTLIELLIAVVVVGILAAVAYPSYTSALQKSHRVDAVTALLNIQMTQEKYRANHTTYTSDFGDLFNDGLGNRSTIDSPNGHYSISMINADSVVFEAMAEPVGTQADDSCGTFYINKNGPNYDPSGAADRACWNQ